MSTLFDLAKRAVQHGLGPQNTTNMTSQEREQHDGGRAAAIREREQAAIRAKESK